MRIIIADDVLKSQMQAYLALHRRHECEIAEDRQRVVTLAREFNPDVILLASGFDSHTENGDWADLVQELKQIAPKCRVIAITDVDWEGGESAARALGVAGILRRPLRQQKLLDLIGRGEQDVRVAGA
ncbi:MAG: response regulator transcription factor [Calditrichaeota bacterium]|nr:response regulator transcription factor [Calditrichota bacterium]